MGGYVCLRAGALAKSVPSRRDREIACSFNNLTLHLRIASVRSVKEVDIGGQQHISRQTATTKSAAGAQGKRRRSKVQGMVARAMPGGCRLLHTARARLPIASV